MRSARFRQALSFAVIAATAGSVAAITAQPGGQPSPSPVSAAPTGAVAPAGLARREARAVARLRLAESRLRGLAASASAARVSAPAAPVVSVAPAYTPPVVVSAPS